jgi:hypothetical protein
MQNTKILTILCKRPKNLKCFRHFQFNTSTIDDPAAPDETYKKPALPKKPRSKGEPFRFVDYKKVFCIAGNGGDGLISFLREKNVEFGKKMKKYILIFLFQFKVVQMVEMEAMVVMLYSKVTLII